HDEGATLGVDGHAGGGVGGAAAEVGGVDECRAGRVDLAEEGVGGATAVGRLQGFGGRQVGRGGGSGDEGVAVGVHCDRGGLVDIRAADVSGVGEGAPGVALGEEGVLAAALRRLERRGGGGKVARRGPAGHVGVAAGVHGDAPAAVVAAAAEVSRPDDAV